MPEDSSSGEGFIPGLQMASFSLPHVASIYVCSERVIWYFSFSKRALALLIVALPFLYHLTIIISLRPHLQIQSHWGWGL